MKNDQTLTIGGRDLKEVYTEQLNLAIKNAPQLPLRQLHDIVTGSMACHIYEKQTGTSAPMITLDIPVA